MPQNGHNESKFFLNCIKKIYLVLYIFWIRRIQARSAIEIRKQLGHWECDTVISANRKGAIMTMVERRCCFSVIVKVSQKTSELVRVITLTYDNGELFRGHIQIDLALNSTSSFARPFAIW